MKRYGDWAPTGFDAKGLNLPDRQDWLVVGIGHNRDSGVLDESNWAVALESFKEEHCRPHTYEVHRFGHWGPGWFEIILVKPHTKAEKVALELESALSDYPVLSDDELSDRANAEADRAWSHETTRTRLEYIRRHRADFEFRCFSDLLGCARGKYFAGDALSYCEGY